MNGTVMSYPSSGHICPSRNVIEPVLEALVAAPVKMVSGITGKSPKAVQRWRMRDSAMSLADAVRLARERTEFWVALRTACGRGEERLDAAAVLRQVRELLEGMADE